LSGYDLAFERPVTGLGSWLGGALRGQADAEQATERALFEELHVESGGNLRDGLRLWLAAMRRVSADGQTLVMGPVPSIGTQWSERLAEVDVLTLAQIARSGRLRSREHAQMFGFQEVESRALLDQLGYEGLVDRHPDNLWTIRPTRQGSVQRFLSRRGMLE
jgi:hypothetical protein